MEPNGASNPVLSEDKEMEKEYQTYLQKCCEVGQIRYNLDQLDSQRLELEKQLDVTERAVKGSAQKHRELQKAKFSKLKPPTPPEAPKLEMAPEVAH